ncbi:MAG: glycosyltransferase family 39 protein [bacterium]|nr:glycosyltransferase family 39 protein [bacterium]
MTEEAEKPTENEKPSQLMWFVSCGLVTLLATFLRFYWLGLKPFHHDEGVNGWFLTNLFRDGVYKYDPANYHGPTLYYISLAFADVFGLDTIAIRWSVAIWGVLIVVLAFYLRPYIGQVGSLAAAAFLAISPGMVYISRYFIHEIFFVFLAIGFLLAVLMFMDRERPGLGSITWMALLLLVCVSPPAMYLPHQFAGESVAMLWFIRLGLFAFAGALVFFLIKLLLEWNGGRPIYLLLASACVALMFATKETSFITLGTMAIACVCIWARERINEAADKKEFPLRILGAAAAGSILFAFAISRRLPEIATDFGKRSFDILGAGSADTFTNLFYLIVAVVPPALVYLIYTFDAGGDHVEPEATLSLRSFRDGIGSGQNQLLLITASATLIIYLIVLFFSSFFTYADGVKGFFEAYEIWTKTGSKDHTQNGIWAYIDWGLKSDGPIMILALVGTVVALVRGKNRVAMFAGLWAIGLFLAYTIIPYKTPWLALSFLLPMCIAAGHLIGEIVDSKNNSLQGIGLLLAAGSLAVLAYLTYDLNFVRYDDEDAPMVYAHTSREFLDMIRDIERFAESSGRGKDAAIDIVSPDYWPMVWYMKDYPKAIFHGKITDSTAEMIVAKKGEQDNEVMRRYSANYDYYASYHLRSGVDLVLLVRKDLSQR